MYMQRLIFLSTLMLLALSSFAWNDRDLMVSSEYVDIHN